MRERAQSFLAPENQERILSAYRTFTDDPGFAGIATIAEVLKMEGNLAIARYVRTLENDDGKDVKNTWTGFDADGRKFWLQMDALLERVDGEVAHLGSHV